MLPGTSAIPSCSAGPVGAGLSEHLAVALTGREFDVTVMAAQPEGRNQGHAFTFVRRRLNLAAGGALSGLSFELPDYIPAYRSRAGTGVGMTFATWNRDRAARTKQETAAS